MVFFLHFMLSPCSKLFEERWNVQCFYSVHIVILDMMSFEVRISWYHNHILPQLFFFLIETWNLRYIFLLDAQSHSHLKLYLFLIFSVLGDSRKGARASDTKGKGDAGKDKGKSQAKDAKAAKGVSPRLKS